ncbi:hypothetical protein GCM10023176_39630 [Micromonospora coerulea]|uniref:Uncharacterized protein n=1 Tax=Micromonospora coerulea TaxID=47856 RepID=A0ABP8SSP0_9ACTN
MLTGLAGKTALVIGAISRLHHLLLELVPVGAKKFLPAPQARGQAGAGAARSARSSRTAARPARFAPTVLADGP